MKGASKNISKKQVASSPSAVMNSVKNNNNNNNNNKKRRIAIELVSEVTPAAHSKKKRKASCAAVEPPREIDIVCGRGCGRFARSPGNVAYRQLVDFSRWRYEEAEKHSKLDISRRIVQDIKAQPGIPRFLMENPTTRAWEELSYKKSVEKTSQTFRDLRTKPMVVHTPEEEAAAATLTKLTADGNEDDRKKAKKSRRKKNREAASSTVDLNGQQDAAIYAMHYKEAAEAQELAKKQGGEPKDGFVPKAFRMLPGLTKKQGNPKDEFVPKAFRTLPKMKAAPSRHTSGVVRDTDILYGKYGLPVATHPGSQAFFRIVRFNQAYFHSCTGSKSQQNEVAQSIVNIIQRQGGRFLETKIILEKSKKSTWRDMPNAKAVQKTCQALYQLLSNSDSRPDSNDFLGLCSWLSGKSLLQLQAQDDRARLEGGIVIPPRLTDVLIGRDHVSSQHPGNLAFRWMAHYNRTRYTSCLSRREKVNLIETILAMMQHQGARLVEQNALTKAWCEISNIKSVTETSLALRRAASQTLQPLEADCYQEICQSIVLGASSSYKVGNTSGLPQSAQHKSVVKEEEKEPIVYSNEVFDEPSFPDGKEVPVFHVDEVFFHTPVLEPKLTISVSSMLALEPAISFGQPTSLLSTISFSTDPDLSLGPPLVNTLSWFTTAPATSEPFGRQASSSRPATRTIFTRESSQQHVPPPLLTSLMSTTTENWVDALYYLPDEKFATKHHAPTALADPSNNTHNALDAIPSPPAFVRTQSSIAVWDIEKDEDQEYGNDVSLTLLEETRTPHLAAKV